MPSQLVNDVRKLIRDREDDGRPLTMPERALLLATLAPPRRDGGDTVDELDLAIAEARRALLPLFANTRGNLDLAAGRRALTRLLAASRAVLEHAPDADGFDPTAGLVAVGADGPARPYRADVDG